MDVLAAARKRFSILVIMLNLIFLLILILSNIFIAAEQSNKRQIKMKVGAGVSKHFAAFCLI